MNNYSGKRERERSIFDKVFADNPYHQVVPSDRPDFLVKWYWHSKPFGVEITELFQSETQARLDRIPNYMQDLLQGKDHKHKDDRKKLERIKCKIINPKDGSVVLQETNAIQQHGMSPRQFGRAISDRIRSKTELAKEYSTTVSHTALVIQDNSRLLQSVPKTELYNSYFVPELVAALLETTYREVYLITVIEQQESYVPLKILLLFGTAHRFREVVNSSPFVDRMKGLDLIEVFASYLASKTRMPVLTHHTQRGMGVIWGDASLVVTSDGTLSLQHLCDLDSYPEAISPKLSWQATLGDDFAYALEENHRSRRLTLDVAIPVKINMNSDDLDASY